MPQQGLVVFAKNKKRVSAFYQQTLGLEVQESDSSHDVLRGNDYEVVVHTIPRKYAAGITIAKPPEPREETPFKPTFVVTYLSEVRRAAEATGGYLKPESGAWHFRGHAVLDGWDPEGNIVQFKQAEKQVHHARLHRSSTSDANPSLKRSANGARSPGTDAVSC